MVSFFFKIRRMRIGDAVFFSKCHLNKKVKVHSEGKNLRAFFYSSRGMENNLTLLAWYIFVVNTKFVDKNLP